VNIQNSVAIVTGANRGLGLAISRALLAAGAKKVYAAARDPGSISLPGVIPIQLDVTDPAQVEAAARAAGDVTLLVNNAGIARGTGFLAADSVESARAVLETNFFGTLSVSRAFAPVLASHGGGAIVNILSAVSWISLPGFGAYSASKSAEWSLTNGLRDELRAQGTRVVGLHVGFMDTDMVKHRDDAKSRPEDVAQRLLEGLASGEDEILADETSRQVKHGLTGERSLYLGAPAR